MAERFTVEHGGSSVTDALINKLKSIGRHLNPKSNDLACIPFWYKSRSKIVEAELLTLICSIFPDNFRIPIEDLVSYGMSLDLFEDVHDMFSTRCRIHDIISNTNDKNYSRKVIGGQIRLALEKDGPLDRYVKMIVASRDITKSIHSRYALAYRQEILIGKWPESDRCENCYGLSLVLKKVDEHPVNLEFPKLTLLRLQYREDSQNIPVDFFKSMKELCVLSLDVPSLPHSLNVLRNLKTLHLKVPRFEDMSWIGALINLEFLTLCVSSLADIPRELGQLQNLRLLDLRNMNIAYIPPGVLSRLLKLEELYMPLNFTKWGCKARKYDDYDEWESGEDNYEDVVRIRADSSKIDDGGRINASLIEIVSLSLNALQICVPTASILPKKPPIFKSIREFNISTPSISLYQSFGDYSANVLQLTGEACDIKESGICDLLSKAEELSLTRVRNLRNVIYQLKEGFPQLKKMIICECNELKYVVETTEEKNVYQGHYFLRKLECLHLSMLSNLKEICHERWLKLIWFSNLSQVSIRFCPKLTYVFPLSIVRRLALKSIEILDCHEMEGIIFEDEEDISPTHCLIERLELHSLSRLISFLVCKDGKIDGVKNDINQSLTINEIVSSYADGSISTYARDSKSSRTSESINDKEIFCSPPNLTSRDKVQKGWHQVSVIKNKDVVSHTEMEMYSAFSSIFSVKWFRSLKSLKIAFCDLVKVVFWFRENHADSKAFNSLEVLELHSLQNLLHIWFPIPPITASFKSLQFLVLTECGCSYLFSCRVAKLLVQLEKVFVSRCEKMEEIISGKDVENEEIGRIVLPQLKLLELQHMPNLEILFGVSWEIELPLLECLKLKECNKMKSFSDGLLNIPMLEGVEIDGIIHLVTKDYNYIFSGVTTPHDFTFADLKIATKNFSSDNFLGEVNFGEVYKGWIDRKTFAPSKTSTGMLVSVKRYKNLAQMPYSYRRDCLEREVRMLERRSHKNLVKLFGLCLEDDEAAVVYEFVPGETLYDCLFTRVETLSWDKQVKIAIGAAQGISCLHTSEPKVIHRDIKPHNILLDADYNPKISDFGLAVWESADGDSHGTSLDYSQNFNAETFEFDLAQVIRLRKLVDDQTTVGKGCYIAPDNVASGRVSVKADVYSFGVVLFELMTGSKTFYWTHRRVSSSLGLWLASLLSPGEELEDYLVSLMQGQCSSEAKFLMADLILDCTKLDPELRPTMEEVVKKLCEINVIKPVQTMRHKSIAGSLSSSSIEP